MPATPTTQAEALAQTCLSGRPSATAGGRRQSSQVDPSVGAAQVRQRRWLPPVAAQEGAGMSIGATVVGYPTQGGPKDQHPQACPVEDTRRTR
jgi:hypothetical protein